MKVDYIREGSDDCPFVRIYEFVSTDIQRICGLFKNLAAGTAEHGLLDQVDSSTARNSDLYERRAILESLRSVAVSFSMWPSLRQVGSAA